MTDTIATSPVRCPHADCLWELDGIPDHCPTARDWHLAAHQAEAHGVPMTAEQIALGHAMGYTVAADERQLTPDNLEEVDGWLDRADQFAKPYWETVDGRLTVTGLRIGSGVGRTVARFGDTIVRHPDGTHTVRRDTEAGAR